MSSSLRRQSTRTARSNRARAEINSKARVIGLCALRGYRFPCSGRIDVHEVVRRSKYRDAATDRRVQAHLCRAHHELDGDYLDAQRLGIRVPGWVWQKYGMRAVREAQQIRTAIFMGRGDARDPFWLTDPEGQSASGPDS